MRAGVFSALLALGASACATGPGARSATAAGTASQVHDTSAVAAGAERGAPGFTRSIRPFPVADSAGAPYEHPFMGGLDHPRPQLVDIDDDGDLDLFVQERSGAVMFFERVAVDGVNPDASGVAGGGPGGANARYVWRTDRFAGLDVGEWYRFSDVDGDGDPDLLSEEPFSYIRYYRNEAPGRFTLATDTLRQANGAPLFSDRQNIPNAADIDCDGLLDLLVGRLTGTITRFEEAGVERRPPRFRFVTDRFEDIEIVTLFGGVPAPLPRAPANIPGAGPPDGGPPDPGLPSAGPTDAGASDAGASGPWPTGTLHGANTLALFDVDADGDHDLFWGDFFEQGLLFIENTGTCESPSLQGEPVPFPPGDPLLTSGYNAPSVGDIDVDGDPDVLLGVLGGAYDPTRTTIDNFYLLEQAEEGEYEVRTARFLYGLDVGTESVPAAGDVDGDGDADLLVGNKVEPDDIETGRVYLFENVGTRSEPSLRLRGPLSIEGKYHYAPALGDLDGDGDPDMVLGTWRSEVLHYRNEAGRFVLADSALAKLPRGANAVPALADLDGDDDLDLVVGEASGTLTYFRNEGSPGEPAFVLETERFLGVQLDRRTAPGFADLDADGDSDLLVGTASEGVLLFRNEGTGREPRFVRDEDFTLPVHGLARPALADMDGDADPDLLVGDVSGGVLFFENR